MRNAGHVSRLIGLAGFEPATPSPPDLYAKPLRYSPRLSASYSLSIHWNGTALRAWITGLQ